MKSTSLVLPWVFLLVATEGAKVCYPDVHIVLLTDHSKSLQSFTGWNNSYRRETGSYRYAELIRLIYNRTIAERDRVREKGKGSVKFATFVMHATVGDTTTYTPTGDYQDSNNWVRELIPFDSNMDVDNMTSTFSATALDLARASYPRQTVVSPICPALDWASNYTKELNSTGSIKKMVFIMVTDGWDMKPAYREPWDTENERGECNESVISDQGDGLREQNIVMVTFYIGSYTNVNKYKNASKDLAYNVSYFVDANQLSTLDESETIETIDRMFNRICDVTNTYVINKPDKPATTEPKTAPSTATTTDGGSKGNDFPTMWVVIGSAVGVIILVVVVTVAGITYRRYRQTAGGAIAGRVKDHGIGVDMDNAKDTTARKPASKAGAISTAPRYDYASGMSKAGAHSAAPRYDYVSGMSKAGAQSAAPRYDYVSGMSKAGAQSAAPRYDYVSGLSKAGAQSTAPRYDYVSGR